MEEFILNYDEKIKKLKMKCPDSISEVVLQFCKTINNETPFFITPSPYHWCLPNECINNVYQYNSLFGGKFILGWSIWKNELIIEGELHCLVVNPDGSYSDITPNTSKTVLFLPDYDIKFDGTSVDNIRKPLVNHPLINKFIKKYEERAQLLMPYGRITLANESKVRKIEKEISKITTSILNNPDLF